MKVLRLLLLSCMVTCMVPCMVGANDLSATIRDSIGGADTTAIYRYDTAYTESMRVHGYRYIVAVPQTIRYDSNFIEDTLIVLLQHSWDNQTWLPLIAVDTMSPTDTLGFGKIPASWGVTATVLDVDAAPIVGNYIRGMFILYDSLETANKALADNVYVTELKLWVGTRSK